MTQGQQRVLVIGLAAVAGSLDSWSYFGLAEVFIANMTGNTVLLGASLATRDWPRAGGAGAALACYAVGVALGTRISRPRATAAQAAGSSGQQPPGQWPRAATRLLMLQFLVLLGAISVACWLRPPHGSTLAYSLAAVGAASVGLQSAAAATFKLPGVMTTYITGTWTTMVVSVARRVAGEAPSEVGFELVPLQLAVLVVYCGAAAGAAALMQVAGKQNMGWLPVGLLGLVTFGAYGWNRPVGRSKPADDPCG